MKKKVLSLVLALLMAASSASAVLAEEAIADVEETAVVEEVAEAGQYDKAIAFLANYGIFKGISADDLGADLDVERYQMALFVARVSTGWVDDSKWEDGPENWSEFTDISEGPVANYWGALSYVNAKGIIEGYGNGKFGPTDGITYQNALTMTVRTLGYTGLEWPWGYIEKAVSLGLTDGITDVAYTDELTRGEVAQIIYNAMFAKTKNGSTLALDNFGLAFGWEKVIVTASDLNTFTADKTSAALTLKDDKATRYYKDSNKPAAGLVNFQILNDDGTLADDVYTVNAAALGLVGEHDDELAVGDAYYVLFEQNKDEEFVNVVAYESLLADTLVNAGKTDDEGEDVDYEINEWLDDHTLVSKYSSNAYINMTKPSKNEVIVFADGGIEIVTGSDYAIAIDWDTGDILVPVDTDKDGDWKDEWDAAKGDASKIEFELKYSWNTILNKYYTVVFDRDVDDFGDVAVDYIDAADIEKLLEKYTFETKATVKGFSKAVDSITKSAYAALKLYDTNLDGAADRGIYETYRLGYFENKAVDPSGCDCGALDHYVVSDVNTVTEALAAYEAKEGKKSSETKVSISVREEGVVCKHDAARAWIVDDSVLVAAVDEDGEETGYYAPAYVLYNYDAETGALKIVKNITDGEDVDSYVANGVVRAYNVNKGTITIGEETYDFNNYAELLGNGFRYANDNVAAKSVYSALLRSLFNQYVKAVVVDGELVHISAIGAERDEVIVVESYAGISSDGYVVVNGYSTDDLKYDQFRLGSIEGWEEGDIFYYEDEYTFTRGTVLTIASYDEDADVYYVNYAGGFNSNGKYVVEDGVNLDAVLLVADDDGYVNKYTKYDEDEGHRGNADSYASEAAVKMTSGDKYIIVDTSTRDWRYASVRVYEGKLEDGTVIYGDVIKYTDGSSDTYVFVNAWTNLADAYETGLVVLLRDSYFSANYNGEGAEDWYLLGAAEYEVNVVDLLTGKLDATKYATNKKYDKGYAYYTQGDVLVSNGSNSFGSVNAYVRAINNAYPDADTYYAARLNVLDADGEYTVLAQDKKGNDITFDALYNTKDGANKTAIGYMLLAASNDTTNNFDLGTDKVRGDKVDGVTYRVIVMNEDNEVVDVNDKVAGDDKGSKALNKFIEDGKYTTLTAFYVYDVEGADIVIYLVVNDNSVDTVVTDKADQAEIDYILYTGLDADEDNDTNIVLATTDRTDVEIVAKDIKYTATLKNDEISSAAINALTITFAGDYIDGNEDLDIEACDDHTAPDFIYSFGDSGKVTYVQPEEAEKDCTKEVSAYVMVGTEKVAAKITEIKYDDYCKLIKGYTLELAEDVAITGDTTVAVYIPHVGDIAYEYAFNVALVEDVELADGTDVVNKLIVTEVVAIAE